MPCRERTSTLKGYERRSTRHAISPSNVKGFDGSSRSPNQSVTPKLSSIHPSRRQRMTASLAPNAPRFSIGLFAESPLKLVNILKADRKKTARKSCTWHSKVYPNHKHSRANDTLFLFSPGLVQHSPNTTHIGKVTLTERFCKSVPSPQPKAFDSPNLLQTPSKATQKSSLKASLSL